MERPAVRTVSVTAVATGVFDFRFEGYSLTTKASSDEFYQSEPFDVGGHSWAMHYYPSRLSTHVSLFPVLLSEAEPSDVGATFTAALLDWSGEPSPEDEDSVSQFFVAGDEEQATLPLAFWKAALEGPDFVAGDCFVVRCTVIVLRRPRGELKY